MTKAFEMMMEGLEDAIAYTKGDKERGRVAATVNVRAIREATGKTREEFANTYHLALGTVRDWEQNKRNPDGPARVLLAMIEKAPEAVADIIAR